MLQVAGPLVEVPDLFAWNRNVMEERFDPVAADVASISYQTLLKAGRQILGPVLAKSSESKIPVYIPSIPRFVDALLDQYRYCQDHPGIYNNTRVHYSLALYNLTNLIRYLHLEKPHQREKLIPELAERNRADMVMRLNKYKRKPNMAPKNSFLRVVRSRDKTVSGVGEAAPPSVKKTEEWRYNPTDLEAVHELRTC